MTKWRYEVRLGMLAVLVGGAASSTVGCDEPAPETAPPAAVAKAVAEARAVPSAAAPPREIALQFAKSEPPKQKLEDCPSSGAVTFDNEEVEKAVRLKAAKPVGAITRADLARLRSLNVSQTKLDRLDLCLFHPMTGLRELFLGAGKIADLSPIAGATKLESLRASLNPIQSLEPLTKMTGMDRLDLAHTEITDLTPLSGMKSLTELLLDSTPVSDISPLAELAQLEVLVLKNTRVKDLTPLKGLKALKSLDVRGTPVEDTLVVTRAGLRLTED